MYLGQGRRNICACAKVPLIKCTWDRIARKVPTCNNVPGTGSAEHLRMRPDPLVGNPLGADHDGAAAMLGEHVVAATLVHVPPDHHAPLHGAHPGTDQWEHRVAA
jgi:hypothetical protein